jgi:hypothetical protein
MLKPGVLCREVASSSRWGWGSCTVRERLTLDAMTPLLTMPNEAHLGRRGAARKDKGQWSNRTLRRQVCGALLEELVRLVTIMHLTVQGEQEHMEHNPEAF